MASLDDVWVEMKQKAIEYADRGVTPTYREAESVVTSLLGSARLDPKPGHDVIEFYTRELIALAERASPPEARPA